MKCPCCLAKGRFSTIRNLLPAYLFPVRPFVVCVRCDSCLHLFYRLRGTEVLFKFGGPALFL